MNSPTYAHLVKHLEHYGPEYILESAQHLSEEERERLAKLVNDKKKDKKRGRGSKK